MKYPLRIQEENCFPFSWLPGETCLHPHHCKQYSPYFPFFTVIACCNSIDMHSWNSVENENIRQDYIMYGTFSLYTFPCTSPVALQPYISDSGHHLNTTNLSYVKWDWNIKCFVTSNKCNIIGYYWNWVKFSHVCYHKIPKIPKSHITMFSNTVLH